MAALQLEARQLASPGKRTLVCHERRGVVLFNVDGSLHAIEDECPHAGTGRRLGSRPGRTSRGPMALPGWSYP